MINKLIILILLSIATAAHGAKIDIAPWTMPVESAAAQVNLAPASDGGLWLSWIEPGVEGHQLRAAYHGASGFSPSLTIAQGTNWFVNWADFPALRQLSDGSLVAVWLQRHAQALETYGMRLVRSADAGASWSAPLIPHDDSLTEHGFVSMWDAGKGAVGMAWLDGRQMQPGAHDHGTAGAPMTLHGATFDSALQPVADARIDASVCDCCQTDVALTDRGPVLVYRDRADGEVRDIAIVRLERGQWSKPALVHVDGWVMPACPVNGPAVAARGKVVIVAWYTGAQARPRVLLARSADRGQTFSAPIELAGDDAQGRVDVAIDAQGRVWVTWLTGASGDQILHVGAFDLHLREHARAVAHRLTAGRATGFPRILALDDVLYASWVVPRDGGPRLAGARMTLSD